eukprot:m.485929 g.485929  ORF g.485929 m.485929 type:complete len:823 (-) comp24071_c0_seq1:75-2543(-)
MPARCGVAREQPRWCASQQLACSSHSKPTHISFLLSFTRTSNMASAWCAALCSAVVLLALALADAKTVPATNKTVETRACQPPHDTYPFCNHKLSITDRVNNLISLLEVDEKPLFLTAREGGGGSPGPGPAVPRLGVPEYDWGVNCIHGVQTSCIDVDGTVYCPTSFPNPVNYGYTFNTSLFYELGSVIGRELRALWISGATEYSSWSGRPHAGLDCWSPNINIARDPRWGRNMETPGEDPYLNGLFGAQYTKGLQEGEDSNYLQAVVTLKHWDAYSLETSDGHTRHNFNAIVSNQTLANTYWPAFKASVQTGGAKGVMCSYNSINGVPTCANPMLTKVLRDTWGFEGYVTSDTGAVADIYGGHHYVSTPEEAACAAIKQHCDVNSGAVYHDHLIKGVQQKSCSMDDVDEALRNTLTLRFQLGLFDPIEDQPYWHVPPTDIHTSAANASNLLATLESMVLLKNDANTLPLPKGKNIAVIGPHGKAQSALVGNYLGQICPADNNDCVETPLEAINKSNVGGTTTYAEGSGVTKGSTSDLAAAVEVAKKADYVVILGGIDTGVEGENHDRVAIALPDPQQQLIDAIVKVGKPTVLVLINGGMVAIDSAKESVSAIVEAGYPGFLGATAIASTLFGDNDHLGGKLSTTWYPSSYIHEIKMSEMELDVGPGRTYRYYSGEPLWPFGFGLALTTFDVKNKTSCEGIELSTEANAMASHSVEVTNTGSRTGDTVVFLYMTPSAVPLQSDTKLIKQLIAFQRVHLAPGASTTVTFDVTSDKFAVALKNGDMTVAPGEYKLTVSDGVSQTYAVPTLLTGAPRLVEAFPRV